MSYYSSNCMRYLIVAPTGVPICSQTMTKKDGTHIEKNLIQM